MSAFMKNKDSVILRGSVTHLPLESSHHLKGFNVSTL